MEYTEEVKKEADEVLKRISTTIIAFLYKDSDNDTCLGEGVMTYKSAVNLAIQDRQSVFEEVRKFEDDLYFEPTSYDYLVKRIQSLTKQIEYLKSKL